MAIKDWKEVIHEDFPHPEVTRHMLESAQRQGILYGGCVRFATGRISTSREIEERRKEAYQKDEDEERSNTPEPKPTKPSLFDYLRNLIS